MNRLLPICLGSLFLTACGESAEDAQTRADLAEVIRGAFDIAVTESGEIKAAKSTRVKNEMEGNSTIIYLIDEGTIVKKGDLLVELDASGQIERRATQEIAVEKAKAAVVNARKSLEILRKQVQSDIRAAKNTWTFAIMDKDKFYGERLQDGSREMGEQEQSIKAEEAEIDLAKSELKLAQDRYNWSVKLHAKDFITQDDLDRDRLDFESKKTRLTLAINKLAILKKYTHEKTKRELDQAEDVARIEYERTVAKGEAEITQAEADLNAKIKEDQLATERLDNLEKQIKSARVLAPTPGIVVYASEGDRWRRRTIEIGTQVRERQSLIILPDTSHMLAELKIQEVMIDKIRPGLPAQIKIDSQDTPLIGRVLRRAPLPDSGSRGGNPDLKEYKTVVDIEGRNEDQLLRPNMSATIKIIIARLNDVISVPQAAVFSQGSVRYVWLETEAGPKAVPVEIGEHNESHVIIEKGLSEGQQVRLVEPEGVQTPEFEQPPEPKVQAPTKVEKDTTPKGKPGAKRPAAGGMDFTALRKLGEDFKKKVLAKNPDLHKKIAGAGRAWMRNEEIKGEIEADSELAGAFAAYQAALTKAMRGMGGGGSGRRGRPEGESGGRGEGGRSAPGGPPRVPKTPDGNGGA